MSATASNALTIGTGETLLFALIAVVMVLLSVFGLLVTRRTVYAAVCVIGDMVCFAILYTMLEAPFMGVVQVTVYTGAILMMFLFVLMMIGVDPADSPHETLTGQRILAAVVGSAMAVVAIGAVLIAKTPAPVGMESANAETNPAAVAGSIFGKHALTMELVDGLLIVAVLGAMMLTHRERVRRRITQAALADAKMAAFAEKGRHIGQKPAPGVYAESNSAAAPALTVGGAPVRESVNRVLRIRGQALDLPTISPLTAARAAEGKLTGTGARSVAQSGMPGMPGESAPVYDDPAPALESNDVKEIEQ